MKYTVEGFSQKVAVAMGLRCDDLVLLRWLVDFSNTGDMVKMKAPDGNEYMWVNYKYVLEELPIVQCNKKNLTARLKRLVEAGVLINTTLKQGGTYSLYRFGPRLKELIGDTQAPLPEIEQPLPEIEQPGYPISTNPVTQNQATKYPSIKRSIYQKDSNKEKKLKEKDGEDEPRKMAFGECENVFLSADEYAKLLVKMGDIGRDEYINTVSLYKGKTGREYKSDYAACLAFWQRDGRPVKNAAKIVEIPVEVPDLSTPEKILEAIWN